MDAWKDRQTGLPLPLPGKMGREAYPWSLQAPQGLSFLICVGGLEVFLGSETWNSKE